MENIFYLLSNDLNKEIAFGIDDTDLSLEVENKFNKGLSKIKPWTECVPYYKKSKFYFVNENALKYFMFKLCNFTDEDLNHLDIAKYKIYKFEGSCLSSGLSKTWTTNFEDEIELLDTIKISDFIQSDKDKKCRKPREYDVPKSEIANCKNQYYNNIKTLY